MYSFVCYHKLPDAGFIVIVLNTFIPVSNSANILSNGVLSIIYMVNGHSLKRREGYILKIYVGQFFLSTKV